jgi:acyl-CoA reductase-like NAD-dependent aldehyde dehydrogenase
VTGIVRKLKIGDGLEAGTAVGPLITPAALDKVSEPGGRETRHKGVRSLGRRKQGTAPTRKSGPAALRTTNRRPVNRCTQVTAHVSDALAKGGKLLAGGGKPELSGPLAGGTFFAPTVIGDATIDM